MIEIYEQFPEHFLNRRINRAVAKAGKVTFLSAWIQYIDVEIGIGLSDEEK